MIGFLPKVLNRRLNQTTSGFCCLIVLIKRYSVLGSSNDQHLTTVKPSVSL